MVQIVKTEFGSDNEWTACLTLDIYPVRYTCIMSRSSSVYFFIHLFIQLTDDHVCLPRSLNPPQILMKFHVENPLVSVRFVATTTVRSNPVQSVD